MKVTQTGISCPICQKELKVLTKKVGLVEPQIGITKCESCLIQFSVKVKRKPLKDGGGMQYVILKNMSASPDFKR